MADIRRSRVIAATPQASWALLADFGALSSWVDRVDHSCLLHSGPGGDTLGTARRVQVGRNALVERIIECDPPTTLAYAIEGLPHRLGSLANRWTLRESGEGTEVTVASTVAAGAGPLAALTARLVSRAMATQSEAMLDGLAGRLERP